MVSLRSLLSRRSAGASSDEVTLARIDAAFAAKEFSTGIALARTLAERGDAGAAFRLGEVFEHGIGVLQDYAQAAQWYEQAANGNLAEAWAKLGDFYLTGRGTWKDPDSTVRATASQAIVASLSVAPDQARAAQFNRQAAEAGIIEAQTRLGLQYLYGLGLEKNVGIAIQHLTSAGEAGAALAQRAMGSLCLERGSGEALAEAAEWFRKASAQGDAPAQSQLAAMILNRQAEGDDRDAFDLLLQSAEAGDLVAMTILGDLYRHGRGTAVDLSAAETWLRRAAVRGHVRASNALGMLLIEDIEPRDYVSAAHAFRESAEKDDPFGQMMLGRLLLTGLGVPEDQEQAIALLHKAAEQGQVRAIELLAAIHEGHLGRDADPAAAAELFERAAEEGSVDALYHRARIAMSTDMLGDGAPVIAMLEEAANRGSAAACLQLGQLHAEGDLVVQDYAKAVHWYREANRLGLLEGLINLAFLQLHGHDPAPAEPAGLALLEDLATGGDQRSMWALANLYREGLHVPADWLKSVHWLKVAARAGNGAASCLLVHLLDEPTERTPGDASEIAGWVRNAAELGDAQAQAVFGRMLYEGRHVRQDFPEAFRFIHKAAEAGIPFAQAWMGDVLARGEGVMKDDALSRTWYERAAGNGHLGAAAVLRSIDASD